MTLRTQSGSESIDQNFAKRTLRFYKSLSIKDGLPEDIKVLNPYKKPKVIDFCQSFYNKYYSDNKGRRLILGINPGRFGAGVTGIPFTDPIRLEEKCGITNNFIKRPEYISTGLCTRLKGGCLNEYSW